MQNRLIIYLLTIGLVLAFSGQSSRVTDAFLSLAIHAQKNGVISLGRWNRELITGQKKDDRLQQLSY